jgi:protein SCO1/2
LLRGLLIAALLAGCSRNEAGVRSEWRGTLLPEPIEKPDFTLTDTNGQPFSFRAATEGQVTLLFFGYTNCPDVCPIHLASLAAVRAKLPFEMKNRLRIVFVTTDPARDTPERMRTWLEQFDADFVGLRGDSAHVARIQGGLRMASAILGPRSEDGRYTVGHTAQVLAFTMDNRAHLQYPFGTRQEDWAHDLPRLLEASW